MIKPVEQRPLRIVVADDEQILAQKLVAYFQEKGFEARMVSNGRELVELFKNWAPDVVFCDLMLPDVNALQFLKQMNNEKRLGSDRTKIFVLSGHNSPANIRECMRLGASDYVLKPVAHADLLARVVLHMHSKKEPGEFNPRSEADFESGQYYLYLADLLLREALKGSPVDECMHNITGMTALSMKAVRVSVIKCDMQTRKGQVFASNDKRSIAGLELDLGKYPEVNYVMNAEKILAIENLVNDPTMHFVARQTKSIHFNAMIVSPIRIGSRVWGVFSIRLPDTKKNLADHEIRFAQLAANVIGMVIRTDAQLMEAPEGDSSSARSA